MQFDLKKFYDDLYRNNQGVFGESSLDYLQSVCNRLPMASGRALDVGAGEGITSRFLAQQGYLVDAVDLSDNVLTNIQDVERIFVHHGPVEDFVFKDDYQRVLFALVAHHFELNNFVQIVSSIQQKTLLGGIHIYRLFTTDSDFYRQSSNQGFYDDGLKLDACYRGWKIVLDEKVITKASTQDASNEVRQVVFQKH